MLRPTAIYLVTKSPRLDKLRRIALDSIAKILAGLLAETGSSVESLSIDDIASGQRFAQLMRAAEGVP